MSTKIKGIDVSKWQGTIDWAKVAGDGVKFAMIRLGYGSKDGKSCGVDKYFQKNVENALKNGIAVGCYFYSYALSIEAVKKEAAFVVQQLAKYKGKILYPIAFDIEDSSQAGLGKETLTSMVRTFCSALEDAGYYTMFYCNTDWAQNRLNMTALACFDMWLAQWASSPTYKGHAFNMWQNSCKGRVAGISGDVDMDVAYVDYEALIKKGKLNGYTGKASTGSSTSVTDGKKLRQKVCDIINAWVGSTRGDKKHLEILSIYNGYTPLARGYKVQVKDAHCATTTSAAYIKAGIAAYTGTECGVEEFTKIAKKKGIWTEKDSHVPAIGDACVYDWQDDASGDNTGFSDHIGIVTEVNGSSSFVVTEGNMSGGKVGKRTMEVNGQYIRGFITPDFDAIAKKIGGSSSSSEKTNSSGSTGTNSSSKALAFKVGDVVQFTGKKHYTSANAEKGKSCKSGKAKVTAVYKSGAHPYHVVAVSGSGSNVHGWVDKDDLEKISKISVGDVVQFAGGPHYKSASAKVHSGTQKAGPAKVTAISKGSKHPYHVVHTTGASSVYGWVDSNKVSK